MCWNRAVSAAACAVAWTTCAVLRWRDRPRDRWYALYLATYPLTQVIDIVLWTYHEAEGLEGCPSRRFTRVPAASPPGRRTPTLLCAQVLRDAAAPARPLPRVQVRHPRGRLRPVLGAAPLPVAAEPRAPEGAPRALRRGGHRHGLPERLHGRDPRPVAPRARHAALGRLRRRGRADPRRRGADRGQLRGLRRAGAPPHPRGPRAPLRRRDHLPLVHGGHARARLEVVHRAGQG